MDNALRKISVPIAVHDQAQMHGNVVYVQKPLYLDLVTLELFKRVITLRNTSNSNEISKEHAA